MSDQECGSPVTFELDKMPTNSSLDQKLHTAGLNTCIWIITPSKLKDSIFQGGMEWLFMLPPTDADVSLPPS